MPRMLPLFIALALPILSVDCAKKKPPVSAVAEGRVFRADGKRMPLLKVEFVPHPFSNIKSTTAIPFALADEGTGRFSARAANPTDPLIPARKYKVTVKGALPKDRDAVPAIYGDPLTTPFEIDVTGQEISLEIK